MITKVTAAAAARRILAMEEVQAKVVIEAVIIPVLKSHRVFPIVVIKVVR